MSPKATELGGKDSDPNTEATERPYAEAFDHGAEERTQHAYTEEPSTGATDLEGKPLALAGEG